VLLLLMMMMLLLMMMMMMLLPATCQLAMCTCCHLGIGGLLTTQQHTPSMNASRGKQAKVHTPAVVLLLLLPATCQLALAACSAHSTTQLA
jgi:hypothetical protein